MNKAFVTGATGFLGINIVRQLIEQGVEVHALKRESSNTEELDGLDLHWHIGDVTDLESMRRAIPDQTDVFFHAAADTSMWRQGNAQQDRINLDGTRNAIEAALNREVGRFVHTSSVATYGLHTEVITEQSEKRGKDSFCNYFRTKHLSEMIVLDAVRSRGLDAVILNPAALVGAPDKHNWSQMIFMIQNDRLPGLPPGAGSFCDIQEVAKAHITAAEKGKSGENYILSGVDMSFVEFAAMIGEILGKPTPSKPIPAFALKTLAKLSEWSSLLTGKEPDITPEKAMVICDDSVPSSAKAQQELGYRADIDVRAALQSCCDWMRQRALI